MLMRASLRMCAEQPTYVPLREAPIQQVGTWGSAQEILLAREAELKHGRLAMLSAVAVPIQEMVHPALVDIFGAHSLLVDGKSPSLLNGGLTQPEVLPALLGALVLGSALEIKDLSEKRDWGVDAVIGWMLGNDVRARQPGSVLSVDPNDGYSSLSQQDKLRVMDAELLNGRVAMLAVAAYVLEEEIFHTPVAAFANLL